ncbi:hypothetical protein ACI65C_002314 [Semiaphis heraclei]
MWQGCTRTYVSAETPLVRSTRFGEYRRADHHHHHHDCDHQRTKEKAKHDRPRKKLNWKHQQHGGGGDDVPLQAHQLPQNIGNMMTE